MEKTRNPDCAISRKIKPTPSSLRTYFAKTLRYKRCRKDPNRGLFQTMLCIEPLIDCNSWHTWAAFTWGIRYQTRARLRLAFNQECEFRTQWGVKSRYDVDMDIFVFFFIVQCNIFW